MTTLAHVVFSSSHGIKERLSWKTKREDKLCVTLPPLDRCEGPILRHQFNVHLSSRKNRSKNGRQTLCDSPSAGSVRRADFTTFLVYVHQTCQPITSRKSLLEKGGGEGGGIFFLNKSSFLSQFRKKNCLRNL